MDGPDVSTPPVAAQRHGGLGNLLRGHGLRPIVAGMADDTDTRKPPTPSGDAVYGLGMIGAWVYFWRRADTNGDRALGLLKGLVWPAFLVYEAFSAVAGRPE